MSGPQLTILDCTIRDGGLINRHRFEHALVRDVFRAVSAAGVPIVELGYRNSSRSLPREEHGPWMFCEAEDVAAAIDGIRPAARLSVMVDVGRSDPQDFGPAEESPFDLVRVASYVEGVGEAIELSRALHHKGYATSVNLMAISRAAEPRLGQALARLAGECPAEIVYLVDSFGALHPGRVRELSEQFQEALPGKLLGFHGHNHQQLAFANSLAAIEAGVQYVDATVNGIGRAAGNCPLELLLGSCGGVGENLRPVLELIAERFVPLRDALEWGYQIPFALTGMLGLHPRSAIALRASEARDDYGAFLESLLGEVEGESS